jgi:hypothetical protein
LTPSDNLFLGGLPCYFEATDKRILNFFLDAPVCILEDPPRCVA